MHLFYFHKNVIGLFFLNVDQIESWTTMRYTEGKFVFIEPGHFCKPVMFVDDQIVLLNIVLHYPIIDDQQVSTSYCDK